jgi:hypothetical protein
MTAKTVKVTRTTGDYDYNCYNFKIQKKAPSAKVGWTLDDAFRNQEQAKNAVTSNPPGCAIIFQPKPETDRDFPYYLYINESARRKRWAEAKETGVKWK